MSKTAHADETKWRIIYDIAVPSYAVYRDMYSITQSLPTRSHSESVNLV